MIVKVKHHCSDFNSYRAARVKSLFNAENGCDWERSAELPVEGLDWKIGLIVLGINQENLNKYKLRFSDCLELQKKYSKLIQLINEKLFIEKKLLYDLYNQKNYLMKNMFI